jgi:hypothetical protein
MAIFGEALIFSKNNWVKVWANVGRFLDFKKFKLVIRLIFQTRGFKFSWNHYWNLIGEFAFLKIELQLKLRGVPCFKKVEVF